MRKFVAQCVKRGICPSDKKLEIFEYALAMKIKLEHKEYGDFIRAISPIITELFEMILKDVMEIYKEIKSHEENKEKRFCPFKLWG